MKIIVVGGVAAGASTAARARRLDEHAEIIVLERGPYVSFANCGLPYHIGGVIRKRDSLVLQTPESFHERLNLDVRIGHEVFSLDRERKAVEVRDRLTGREYTETYDKLVLCPGASPVRPRLPGVDAPRVCVLRDLEDMDRIKALVESGAERAVVIGAGFVGVEMAENLKKREVEVDVVEMLDQVMPPLDPELARPLQWHMEWHGVRIHVGVAASEFRDQGDSLEVVLSDGRTLAADLVLMSVGVRPETTLAVQAGLELGPRGGIKVDAHLQTSDPDIYAAGDAIEVTHTITGEPVLIPLAGPANRQGRIVADNLCGRASTYTSTQGTAVVEVFDMTAGCTGANEKTLKAAGIPYEKVCLHPSGHSGYYPRTAPMQLKLTFAPDTGRVLGAQVVGYDGVDKRLDVLATAIRAGLTVYDLEELELGYAPPVGAAKDPVNMAGFIAGNVLRGDLSLWHPEDYPEKTKDGLVVDVRTPGEYKGWHIPGALNVHVNTLRSNLDKIPKDRPVYLYCTVGFRSYFAHRILRQHGFADTFSLSGGVLTFCAFHGTRICRDERHPSLLPKQK